MALQSPGVQVTVIDESFYTPAEPGTTPLIVVATAQDKRNPAGSLASATTKANAGQAFRITSQRELIELFGVPFFEKTASNTPIHGAERNEYGLLAAYSLLGVSNSVFVVRADVNLGQLESSSEAPGANPNNGAWWVDTQATAWGVQEWNGAPISTTGGQKFTTKIPLVLTDDDADNRFDGSAPNNSVGSIGDYAIVFKASEGDVANLYYKSAGNTQAGVVAGQWVLVGSNDWCASHPTVIGSTVTSLVAGTFSINEEDITVAPGDSLTDLVAAINGAGIQGITARSVTGKLYLYTNGANDAFGDSTRSNAIIIAGSSGAGTTLGSLGIATGTYYGPALQQSPHTVVPQWKETGTNQIKRPTGSVWVKTTEPNRGARWRVKRWDTPSTSWVPVEAPIYENSHSALFNLDRSGGGINLPVNSLFVQYNSDEHTGYDTDPATATFKMWRRAASGFTTITSGVIEAGTLASGAVSFVVNESIKGSSTLSANTISATLVGTAGDSIILATAINAAGFTNIEASVSIDNRLVISHKLGGDFRLSAGTNNVVDLLFAGSDNYYELPVAAAEDYLASNWQPFGNVTFAASGDAPLEEPEDGRLWYSADFSEVDLMVHNGTTWVGFNNHPDYTDAQVIVSASEPELTLAQKAVDKHIWISTAPLEEFPTIYRWSSALSEWQLVDKNDQITEDGVLFADARYGASGATGNTAALISEMRTSDYLDPDAPDPALYPSGMILWNLRRSGGNVKQYKNNYIDTATDNPRFNSLGNVDILGGESMADYATDRWTTVSANDEDGTGSFGRKAQRKVIVQALKSVVDTSQSIRDEERRNFNLIAAPGYPELLSNLVNLNLDRGVTAFVVGDTPLRLPADATSLTRWGTNELLVTDNGDKGIVTYDEYCAVFYPNGFTTDLGGANAVVPASHMMLRTIALSDNVSYPWFAPAGTRRGGITNATAVGYIDAVSGEFQTVSLNEGQRDTLYDLKVNPITFFNGVGLVNYGQKTRARNASALDRINVARLVVYLRSQLQKLARPYVFEPNDKITRDEVKQAVESLLLELVGLRALYDFAVVCDESNNTPARIDRNELWVDIAIEPVKAIEFIYIPLRVKNTGEI
jgi:hypothetical protein